MTTGKRLFNIHWPELALIIKSIKANENHLNTINTHESQLSIIWLRNYCSVNKSVLLYLYHYDSQKIAR